jgi:hypothetical protein
VLFLGNACYFSLALDSLRANSVVVAAAALTYVDESISTTRENAFRKFPSKANELVSAES